jgi:hypothetical protein
VQVLKAYVGVDETKKRTFSGSGFTSISHILTGTAWFVMQFFL